MRDARAWAVPGEEATGGSKCSTRLTEELKEANRSEVQGWGVVGSRKDVGNQWSQIVQDLQEAWRAFA